jgi:hypothetical protein
VDTAPIVGAGRAQGQIFQQIGGMIQQYQLNKEKRQAEEDAAVGNLVNFTPEDLLALETTNPKLGKAVQNLIDGTGGKKDVDIVNAGSAPFVAAKARERDARLLEATIKGKEFENRIAGLDANLKEATQENQIAMSGLRVTATNLTNRGLELNNLINTAKSETERDRYRQEQEKNKQQIAQLKEQTRGIKGKNDIFDLTKDDIIQQNKLKTAEIVQGLVLSAAQVEKLEKEMSLLGQNDVEERQKLQAQIDNLKADTKNKIAEAELFQGQADQIAELTSPTEAPTESSVFKLESIEEGAQGDLFGIAKSKINAIGDFLQLGTPFEQSKDARAQVRSLRNSLLPAFIGSFSERGSEWAKKTAEEILVNENMSDGEFRAALKELPNKLKEKIRVDKLSLKRNLGTKEEQLRMQKNIEEFPVLINDINRILEKDKQSGTATTEEELFNRFRR